MPYNKLEQLNKRQLHVPYNSSLKEKLESIFQKHTLMLEYAYST